MASALDERPDVVGEGFEGADHLGRIAIACFHEDVVYSEGLIAPEIPNDLFWRALERLAVRPAWARAERETGAQRDGQLLEAPVLPRAFLAQLAQARLQPFRGGEGRVPAVGQGHDAAQRGPRVAAHPERDVSPYRLGKATHVLEGEESSLEAGALVAPAGAHDADRLVGPRAALIEGRAQQLDLLAHPSYARPENDPALREMVEGGEGLGGQHGMAVREDEHGGAELRPLCHRRDHAEGSEGLEKRRVGRQGELAGGVVRIARADRVRHHDVIARPQAFVAETFHLASEGEQVGASGRGAEDGEVTAELHARTLGGGPQFELSGGPPQDEG